MIGYLLLCLFAWQTPTFSSPVHESAAATFKAIPGQWIETEPGVWEKGSAAQRVRFVSGVDAFQNDLITVSYHIDTLRDLLTQTKQGADNRALNEALVKLEQREATLVKFLDQGRLERLDPRQASVQKTLAKMSVSAKATPQGGTGHFRIAGTSDGTASVVINVTTDEVSEERELEDDGYYLFGDLDFSSRRCGTECTSTVTLSVDTRISDGMPFAFTYTDRNTNCDTLNNGRLLRLSYRSGPPLTEPDFRYHYYRIHLEALGGCGDFDYSWVSGSQMEIEVLAPGNVAECRLPFGARGRVIASVEDSNGDIASVDITLQPNDLPVPRVQ